MCASNYSIQHQGLICTQSAFSAVDIQIDSSHVDIAMDERKYSGVLLLVGQLIIAPRSGSARRC